MNGSYGNPVAAVFLLQRKYSVYILKIYKKCRKRAIGIDKHAVFLINC